MMHKLTLMTENLVTIVDELCHQIVLLADVHGVDDIKEDPILWEQFQKYNLALDELFVEVPGLRYKRRDDETFFQLRQFYFLTSYAKLPKREYQGYCP